MSTFGRQTEINQAMRQAIDSATQLESVLIRLTRSLKKHDIQIS
jgi:hypothetical protein